MPRAWSKSTPGVTATPASASMRAQTRCCLSACLLKQAYNHGTDMPTPPAKRQSRRAKRGNRLVGKYVNIDMRYAEIAESETDADTRIQRDKLASARDKVTKAAQTYQSAVRTAHTSATAAQRKLAKTTPAPTGVKPAIATSALKPLRPVPTAGGR